MDARIHIFNFAPKNFKIINVRQVLVSATAEYKMEDLDPMQWTMQKIKFCLVTWSQIMPCGVFQVPRVPKEKHYDDSLSRQSRRFKNPNRKPNFMQVNHCRRFSMIIACKSSLCCPPCFGQIPQ